MIHIKIDFLPQRIYITLQICLLNMPTIYSLTRGFLPSSGDIFNTATGFKAPNARSDGVIPVDVESEVKIRYLGDQDDGDEGPFQLLFTDCLGKPDGASRLFYVDPCLDLFSAMKRAPAEPDGGPTHRETCLY